MDSEGGERTIGGSQRGAGVVDEIGGEQMSDGLPPITCPEACSASVPARALEDLQQDRGRQRIRFGEMQLMSTAAHLVG